MGQQRYLPAVLVVIVDEFLRGVHVEDCRITFAARKALYSCGSAVHRLQLEVFKQRVTAQTLDLCAVRNGCCADFAGKIALGELGNRQAQKRGGKLIALVFRLGIVHARIHDKIDISGVDELIVFRPGVRFNHFILDVGPAGDLGKDIRDDAFSGAVFKIGIRCVIRIHGHPENGMAILQSLDVGPFNR